VPYSPATGLPITAQTVSQMVDRVMALPEGTRAFLLAPVVQGRKGEYRKELAEWQRSGYTRVRIDGELYAIEEAPTLDKKYKHDIEVVVDRIVVKDGIQQRLAESFEAALKLADGLAFVDLADMTVAELGGLSGVAEAQTPFVSENRNPELVEGRPTADSRPSTGSGLTVDGGDIPHEVVKLSNMRKTIARRLTESKQQVPHIYLTVDVRLDALLKLRGELNASLEPRGIKLSVNDMLIKALGLALIQAPKCNVSFAGDTMLQYSRADISVAVSVPTGLITPIVTDAANKSLSKISTEIAELAARAKEGKLQPHEYQGGTASISNMGMMGIKQFEAVINPPQAMIMAIGAGEKRPYIVDDALAIATVMSATGSFDHRAIDGADGAQLMKVFKELVEKPLGLVA
jgi:pyruvate dehydrogenase E2 component (dihydrolipoamide acetyltransferase)